MGLRKMVHSMIILFPQMMIKHEKETVIFF